MYTESRFLAKPVTLGMSATDNKHLEIVGIVDEELGDGQIVSQVNCNNKDPLRISVSDPLNANRLNPQENFNRTPSPGLRDRRARWLYNMNLNHQTQTQSGRKKNKSENGKRVSKHGDAGGTTTTTERGVRFNKSFSGRRSKISDSGHHDIDIDLENLRRGHSDSGTQRSTFETIDTPQSTFPHSRWASFSAEDDETTLTPFESKRQDQHHHTFELEIEPGHSLSRQNGIRYSLNLRRKESPSLSISSESDASQEGCENALNPVLLLPNGLGVPQPGGRKHSVLFSSYDAWNEDNIAQSFREMSPSIGNVLEAAWGGETETLEKLFDDPKTMKMFQNGQLLDQEGRTPLHLAAACGNKEAVQFLLNKGAKVNEFDHQKATPLSCAASCGSLSVLEMLLDHGADVNAGYDYGKTALHWSIQAGSVDCAKKLLEKGALQNPPAIFSETALHIAAALGNVECLQLLLDYKADTTLCKGPERKTALHLAAEEGNSACITVLLNAGASHEAKDLRGHSALHIASTCDIDSVLALLRGGANPNATDSNGRRPLHCSVAKGSRAAECVRLLIEKGAEIDAQDNYGYTPLHLAAVNESSQCASILLSHGADVTSKTKAGTTALTLLVRKIPDVMRYLVDRLDGAVTIHDHDPGDPDCEVRLDFRGIVPNVDKKHASGSAKEQSYYLKPRKETEFLTCLLAAGNKKILAHPLSEAFLTLKWQRVRKFFWASLLFQIALVALFTIFVIEVYLIKCPHRRHQFDPVNDAHAEARTVLNSGDELGGTSSGSPLAIEIPIAASIQQVASTAILGENGPRVRRSVRHRRAAMAGSFDWFSVKPSSNRRNRTRGGGGRKKTEGSVPAPTLSSNTRIRGFRVIGEPETTETPINEDDVTIEEAPKCEIGLSLTVIWISLIILVSLMALKEIFQILQSPLSYVGSSENWGQWALIGSVTVTAYIPDYELSYWQYPAAAVAIFLAWGLMLLQVGRFPALGLYVQMLGKVAANFGLFILAYACLLIAFALAFCVLFPEHPPYSSVPLAILKVLTMMVGEVDYEDLFYNEDNANDPALYPITAHILHGSFVIIVTIVLMNLLVGLAVHDIQGLQKGAKLNRLSRQTALISRLESFIFSKRLQSCVPRSIGSVLISSALLVPSSYNWSYYFRPNDPRDQRLPKDLKIAALRVAASKHSSRTIRGHPDIRFHPSNNYNNSYSGSVKNTATTEQQTQAATVRRIEMRLDRLQLQLEVVLKTFNEKFETLSDLVSKDQNKPDGNNSVSSLTP